MTQIVDATPNARRRLCLGLAAGLLGLSALGCTQRKRAPLSSFILLDGSVISTQDLLGKVTLVNFWATSCPACVMKMPGLAATYKRYRGHGFETIAVAMRHDEADKVANFAQTRGLPFKVALDQTGRIASDWGDVRITPTTFILDKQTRIVKSYLGQPNFTALHQFIEQLLAQD